MAGPDPPESSPEEFTPRGFTGQQAVAKDLNTQIDSWTDRLTSRRAALQTMYASLETSLSKLQSQSSWLASQLASTTS